MSPDLSSTTAPPARIAAIDAMRGIVILLMLVDHTREFFFSDHPVSDPVDLATTSPALVVTRLAAHLCAPIFVLLTGVAAWLYGATRGDTAQVSAFLVKRGLFLVALEWTVITVAWSFDLTPAMIYLQVIWAIGLSMIALAALIHLPRPALIAVALILMLGHNLLDPVTIAPDRPGHVLWAVLHDRGIIDLPFGLRARTSYPVLPWIGVIALGYAIGPWFGRAVTREVRRRRLIGAGVVALGLFAVLRSLNGYGDPHGWRVGTDGVRTLLSVLNVTKYPPSADFLLLTLGLGSLALAALDGRENRGIAMLAVFGSAPLFFYILHLYLVHALNRLAGLALGAGDALVSVPNVASLWLIAAIVGVPCWFACRAFARLKRRNPSRFLRYL